MLLRWLERPSVYHVDNDELYEVDDQAFEFLKRCALKGGSAPEEGEFIAYCLSEGLLTERPRGVTAAPVRKSPEPSLRFLELLITERCNLRCRHCYIGDPGAEELPVADIVEVLDEFNRMQGLKVLITGGEPMMHGRFWELNDFLSGYPLRKVLLSNGLLLNSRNIRDLNVEEIQVSIDGLEASHDAIRGGGTFKRAMRALTLALDAGMDVSVSTMIHPGNLGDFDEMERLFRGMGVKEWTVDVPCPTGRMADNPGLVLEPERAGRFLRYGFGGGFHSGGEGFACGLHLVSVLPDGGVARCAFYSDRAAGHISEGLERCWRRIRPLRLSEIGCDCEAVEECRGGCRYRAELLGDPMGKDLFRCAAFSREAGTPG